MRFENYQKALSIVLLALVLLSMGTNVMLYLQLSNIAQQIAQIQASIPETIHTRKITWKRQLILAGTRIEGYVANWTLEEPVRIVRIIVWMGNPYYILWEGDTIVILDNTVDVWNPPPDTVLAHYQFDSHARSPLPHMMSFDLAPGFRVDAGETLYTYRLFNNFDKEDTYSGDGWIMLHYTTEQLVQPAQGKQGDWSARIDRSWHSTSNRHMYWAPPIEKLNRP